MRHIVPVLIIGGVIADLAILACSGSHMTPADATIVSAETNDKIACVEQFKPDQAKIDACRAQVTAHYNAIWAVRFDGGAQ